MKPSSSWRSGPVSEKRDNEQVVHDVSDLSELDNFTEELERTLTEARGGAAEQEQPRKPLGAGAEQQRSQERTGWRGLLRRGFGVRGS